MIIMVILMIIMVEGTVGSEMNGVPVLQHRRGEERRRLAVWPLSSKNVRQDWREVAVKFWRDCKNSTGFCVDIGTLQWGWWQTPGKGG